MIDSQCPLWTPSAPLLQGYFDCDLQPPTVANPDSNPNPIPNPRSSQLIALPRAVQGPKDLAFLFAFTTRIVGLLNS